MSTEAIRNLQDMTEEFRKNPGDKELWGVLSDALEEAEVKGTFLLLEEEELHGWQKGELLGAYTRLDRALLRAEKLVEKFDIDWRVQVLYLTLDEDTESPTIPIVTVEKRRYSSFDADDEDRIEYILSKEWIWEIQV